MGGGLIGASKTEVREATWRAVRETHVRKDAGLSLKE